MDETEAEAVALEAEDSGEAEAEDGGEGEVEGGGEAGVEGGDEAEVEGGGEGEAEGGGEGEAQPVVPAQGLLGLTDVVLVLIMTHLYTEGRSMYHLLRVQKEWPGRCAHRRGLVEVRRTRVAQRRREVRERRLAAATRLAKVQVGMLVLGAPWSQDLPPQVLW